jgi:hypothetical protein
VKVWTLGIRCDKCPATFGVRSVATHVHYGEVLEAIRAEARAAGWVCYAGPGHRSVDLCPEERR